MKRSRRCFGLIVLFASLYACGCSWDSSTYDQYAKTGSIVSCPPGKVVRGETENYVDMTTIKCYNGRYIIKSDSANTEYGFYTPETSSTTETTEPGGAGEEGIGTDGPGGAIQGETEEIKDKPSYSPWRCINENQICSQDANCGQCSEVLSDYRMCMAYQDFGDTIFGSENNGRLPAISFVGDYNPLTNAIFDYPDAGKHNICPSDYPNCYYYKDPKAAKDSYGSFGCISKCPSMMVDCQGNCIDPKTNTLFCGAKGTCDDSNKDSENYVGEACPSGFSCVDGTCTLACGAGQIVCDNSCINPNRDDYHCGAKGTCSDESEESENYKGKDCGTGLNCVNGQCILECLEGQIKCPGDDVGADEKDKKCVNPLKDNEYCGAQAGCSDFTACTGGTFCTGRCQCPSGQNLCSIEEAGGVQEKCIDLGYDNNHCGRCDKACGTGEQCIAGECVVVSCSDDRLMCEVNGKTTCLENSIINCGACGNDCTKHPLAHASVRCGIAECDESDENKDCSVPQYECIYDCNASEGYQKCYDKTGTQVCVDVQTNSEHCGGCNDINDVNNKYACGERKYCSGGKCYQSECTGNQCLVNGQCINTSGACGSGCTNCLEQSSVISASCTTDGKCNARVCSEGFHLKDMNPPSMIYSCERNTNTACGSTNSDFVEDCSKKALEANVASYSCVNGKCDKNCKYGYYKKGTECEPYDATHCVNMNCYDKFPNASGVSCSRQTNGTYNCELVSCSDGYHLRVSSNGTKSCERNTSTACGYTNSTTTYDCTSVYSASQCISSGTCSCASNYSFKKISDNEYYCVRQLSCTNESNCSNNTAWVDGMCWRGYCYAKKCQVGYHIKLDGSHWACIKNTNRACGLPGYWTDSEGYMYTYDEINCTNTNNSTCDVTLGRCKNSSGQYYCQSSYYTNSDTYAWRSLSNCR